LTALLSHLESRLKPRHNGITTTHVNGKVLMALVAMPGEAERERDTEEQRQFQKNKGRKSRREANKGRARAGPRKRAEEEDRWGRAGSPSAL